MLLNYTTNIIYYLSNIIEIFIYFNFNLKMKNLMFSLLVMLVYIRLSFLYVLLFTIVFFY